MKNKTPYDYLELLMNGTITSWDEIPGGNDRYRERMNTVGIFNTAIYHIAKNFQSRYADYTELESVLTLSHPPLVVKAVLKEVWRLHLYRAVDFGKRMISRTSEDSCQEYLDKFVPITLHKATWVQYYAQRIMLIKASEREQRKQFFDKQVPDELKADVKQQCDIIFNERLRLQKNKKNKEVKDDNKSYLSSSSQIKISPAIDPSHLPLPLLQSQTELGLRFVV
jgi:hypothetical protein